MIKLHKIWSINTTNKKSKTKYNVNKCKTEQGKYVRNKNNGTY